MGVVIACVNHKGGCARTTTVVNLASSLANGNSKYGIVPRKVLLVDMDPKGNIATTFGVDKKNIRLTMNELFSKGVDSSNVSLDDYMIGPGTLTSSMKSVWRGLNPDRKKGPPKNIIINNLWILPADLDLSGMEIDLATRVGRENRLKMVLNQAKEDFDIIIIDTPASLGLLTINALSAAQLLLIPIQAEFYALDGMSQLIDSINMIQKSVNPDLRLLGILLTMVQTRSKLCEKVAKQARKYFGERVFETQIPRSVSIAESPLEGAPIVISQNINKSNSAVKSYWDFAKEFDTRLKQVDWI